MQHPGSGAVRATLSRVRTCHTPTTHSGLCRIRSRRPRRQSCTPQQGCRQSLGGTSRRTGCHSPCCCTTPAQSRWRARWGAPHCRLCGKRHGEGALGAGVSCLQCRQRALHERACQHQHMAGTSGCLVAVGAWTPAATHTAGCSCPSRTSPSRCRRSCSSARGCHHSRTRSWRRSRCPAGKSRTRRL